MLDCKLMDHWLWQAIYILSGKTGELLDSDDTHYVWIGHVFNEPGVACSFEECKIELPLTTDLFL